MPRGAKDHASEQAQAIAELIRREMGAQRISGRELARMIGKSERYIRERVSGLRALDLNDLDDIAEALGLDVILILEQAEHAIKTPTTQNIIRMSDYRHTKNVSGARQTAAITNITDYSCHTNLEIDYNPDNLHVAEALADRHAALKHYDPTIEQEAPDTP